jgi:hypothetical protein
MRPVVRELPTTDDITLSDEVLWVGVIVVVVMLVFLESWNEGIFLVGVERPKSNAESCECDLFIVHMPISWLYRKQLPLFDFAVELYDDRIPRTLY